MQGSTITSTVTLPVVLGVGPYYSPLFIEAGGAILPSTAGSAALTAPSQGNRDFVSNAGLIRGGSGLDVSTGPAGIGGNGVVFNAEGRLFNYAEVSGGAGGASAGTGALGGIGFYATQPAFVVNSGTITGGEGGYGQVNGGNGGIGILLTQTGIIVNNAGGVIEGGGPGGFGAAYSFNDGGVGIVLENGGRLSNRGTIAGAGTANPAVFFGGAGTLANSGHISGGTGESAVQMAAGGSIENTGAIIGGNADYYSSLGFNPGFGVSLEGNGFIENSGSITGGAGFQDGYYAREPGAPGVMLADAGESLFNIGSIAGGMGSSASRGNGGIGADGVDVSGGKVSNFGEISGGAGGGGGNDLGPSAPGGSGVYIQGGSLFNDGIIVGGGANYGGDAGPGVKLNSGYTESSGIITGGYNDRATEGSGVLLVTGTFVMRNGFIGGARAGVYSFAPAGSGVLLDGGTFEALRGTIAAGGDSRYGKGGNAIQFGGAATLAVHAGVVFDGAIVGSGTSDTLTLLAGGQGSLNGFGVAGGINDFATIDESIDAHWSLSGTMYSDTVIFLGSNARLTLSGVESSTISFSPSGADRLILDTPSSFGGTLDNWGAGDDIFVVGIHADSFDFANGELTLIGSGGQTLTMLSFGTSETGANFEIKSYHAGTDVIWQAGGEAAKWMWPWHMPISL